MTEKEHQTSITPPPRCPACNRSTVHWYDDDRHVCKWCGHEFWRAELGQAKERIAELEARKLDLIEDVYGRDIVIDMIEADLATIKAGFLALHTVTWTDVAEAVGVGSAAINARRGAVDAAAKLCEADDHTSAASADTGPDPNNPEPDPDGNVVAPECLVRRRPAPSRAKLK